MKSEVRAVSIDALELDLQQYWLILRRRWLPALGVFSSVLLVAVGVSSLQKPVYQAQGKLLLKVDRIASLTGVGTELGEFSPLTIQSSPLKTESEVLVSTPILDTAIQKLQLRDSGETPLQPHDLRPRLTVKPISGADILQITFEDKNPELAAAVINQLMQTYIQSNIAASREQAAEARQVINEQLPRTEAVLRQADIALREFKEQNGIANLEEEAKALVGNASALEAEITRASTNLADVNSRLLALRDRVGLSSETAIEMSALSQSGGVQQALKELQDVESLLAAERSRYGDAYPTVVNLRQREESLRAILQDRVRETLGSPEVIAPGNLQLGETKEQLIQTFVATEVERLGLASRLDVLSNTREFYRQRSRLLPRLEQRQRELERRLETAQLSYATLLKKQQEVQVVEQQNTTGNARVIETATPPSSPIGKKKFLTLVLGTLLAAIAALVTIMVLEARDRSLKTVKAVRQVFNYPWLGLIPLMERSLVTGTLAHALPVVEAPQSPVSAAYRLLQANLKVATTDPTFKTLVVSSAVAGEGKSTVAANLAAAIAQLGRRVLLIDADLHYPQQHSIWRVPNGQGLSDVITKQADVTTAITSVLEGLDLLTAGSSIPHPLAVIDSQAMRRLLESVAQPYDLVILDTPALLAEAEARTLAQMTDGLMLVVRPGVLDRDSARAAHELLQQAAPSVVGIVANAIPSTSQASKLSAYHPPSTQTLRPALSYSAADLNGRETHPSISKLH